MKQVCNTSAFASVKQRCASYCIAGSITQTKVTISALLEKYFRHNQWAQ
jgi:hypothetical protein